MKRQREALELEELAQRVRDGRRPFYQKPAYLAAILPVFGVFLLASAALRSDYLQTKALLAENLAKAANDATAHARQELSQVQEATRQTQADLADVKAQKDTVSRELGKLKSDRQSLSAELKGAPLKNYLGMLPAIAREPVGPEDAVLQALTNLLATHDETSAARLQTIEEYMRGTDITPAERVLLAYCLAAGTEEPARVNEFVQMALHSADSVMEELTARSRMPAVMNVMRSNLVKDSDRAAFLKALHEAWKKTAGRVANDRALPLYLLASWDDKANLLYREAYIDYLRNYREQLRELLASNRLISPATELERLLSIASPSRLQQMATLVLIDHIRKRPNSKPEVVQMLSEWHTLGLAHSNVARRLLQETRQPVTPVFRAWLRENQALIEIWGRSDLSALRDAPPAAWEKIVRGTWVPTTELTPATSARVPAT